VTTISVSDQGLEDKYYTRNMKKYRFTAETQRAQREDKLYISAERAEIYKLP
jgi:hypothetical protein